MTQRLIRCLTAVTVCSAALLLLPLAGKAGTIPVQLDGPASYATGSSPKGSASADFNNDGRLDLAVANGGTVSILLGDGTGSFLPAVNYTAGGSPAYVLTADLNGDGRRDLIVTNYSANRISVMLGNGDGTFQNKIDYSVAGEQPVAIAAGDFNGDGKPDLAVANEGVVGCYMPPCPPGQYCIQVCQPVYDFINSSNIAVLPGTGTGAFLPATHYTIAGRPRAVAIVDANNDGKADLIASNANDGKLYILQGFGNGTFQSAFATGTAVAQFAAPADLAALDLNRDGLQDIVTSGSLGLEVLLGLGNGTFQTAHNWAGALTPGMAVGDFDLDGKTDIVAAAQSTKNVLVFLGNGDGTLGAPTAYPTIGLWPQRIVAGDFDQNGRPDLAVPTSGSGTVEVFLNKGARLVSPTSASFSGMELNVESTPQTFTIGNLTTDPLSVSSIGVEGTDYTMFRFFPGGPTPCPSIAPTLPAGTSCTVQATFKPTAFGSRTANLVVLSDLAARPMVSIPLTGQANPFKLQLYFAGSGAGKIIVPVTNGTLAYQSGPQSRLYSNFETVTLEAEPATAASFAGWDGCDSVNNTLCTVTMTMSHNVTATFAPLAPISIISSATTLFDKLLDAYNGAADGDIIRVMENNFTENLQLTRPISLTLRGGLNRTFDSLIGISTILGTVAIEAGDASIENLAIKGALSIGNGTTLIDNVSVL